MRLHFQTLTPIWTGDVLGHADAGLQPTGLLGSMRWWYEVFVRGVGGHACSATGDDRCTLDPKELPATLSADPLQRREDLWKAGLCDVCQLFGATNWRRRFNLVASGNLKPIPGWPTKDIRAPAAPSWHKGWFFPSSPLEDRFALDIVPNGGDAASVAIAAGLLQFMADWAALGAKAQLGMGVVQLTDAQGQPLTGQKKVARRPLYDRLEQIAPVAAAPGYDGLPNLRNLFISRVPVVVGGTTPREKLKKLAAFKFGLRSTFHDTPGIGDDLRHEMMGVVDEQGGDESRRGSRIKVSLPYTGTSSAGGWEMRVWGWAKSSEKNVAFPVVKDYAAKMAGNELVWYEFDSPRHSLPPAPKKPLELAALLLEVTT